ncbi:MAG: hypothetical protein K2G32_01525 [Oscillospiraceae bacterium]|nr:hypothetical protein [Oscillospiraceae bacterium]
MKTFLKHLTIDLVIVFGNTFLSYGLLFLWYIVVVLLQYEMQHLTLLLMCALQIAINILLYKTLLKKFYEPAEHKNPVLYLLLPIVTAAVGVGAFKLLDIVGYEFDLNIDYYLRALINYLPVVLLTLLPPLIAYRLCFKKSVGEAYCVNMLSVFGVAMFPITILLCYASMG